MLASGGVDGFCRSWNVMDGSIIHKTNLSHSLINLFFVFDVEEQQKIRLALAMGGHEHLGLKSMLSLLPDDLLNTILTSV